jgi:amino acid transporter
MPVPHDIYSRVIVSRFRRRRLIVLAVLGVILLFIGYHVSVIYFFPALSLRAGMNVRDRLIFCFMAFIAALVAVYVTYRCPNCNNRPLGKHWLGFHPRRCPACKIGLRQS